MQGELKKMHKESGITFVYVTHDQEEALTMSDKIAVIKDGVIQQYNTPQKIYDEPSNAFVADFIGESNILSGVMRSDFSVEFLGTQIRCLDKGFEKNEQVDLVIRPEDISIFPDGSGRGQLRGTVLFSIFKGSYYQMDILSGDYEFTAESTMEAKKGDTVELYLSPNSIHIMKKTRTVNEFITETASENTVYISNGEFEFVSDESFVSGEKVKARIAFDKVELTDDEEDGTIGGNIAQSLYKGSYYQVQVYTDDDMDFYVDTADEWDTDDRVGIKIKPEDIIIERILQEDDSQDE
jgi:spermidine/putrescine transport system ATP-binding protein